MPRMVLILLFGLNSRKSDFGERILTKDSYNIICAFIAHSNGRGVRLENNGCDKLW